MVCRDLRVELVRRFHLQMRDRDHFSTLPIIALLLAITGVGCRHMSGQAIAPIQDRSVHNATLSPPVASHMPSDSQHSAYKGLAVNPIRKFYSRRQERLFWTSNQRTTIQADSVIAFIGNIRYYGLLPDSYHLSEIKAPADQLASMEDIFRYEALLTDAYISMIRHIWLGKSAPSTPRSDSICVALLEKASIEGGVINNLTALENSLPGYRSLKHGLQLLIDSLPEQQREAILSNSISIDDHLISKLRTIDVNLERWRSEKASFGDTYILINIPAFMLYVVRNDSVIIESKVIVGTPEKQTPELSSVIECFITYPYWHVPRKIAIEEYLPVIQKNTSFIERNNFDVIDRHGNIVDADSVDWKKFNENYFPVRLRQREGTENALGVIKFVFDNPYAVFLHDTNAKRLFRHRVRAFSHGCIRMEKAVELSHYLVTGSLEKRSKYVDRFLKEESRHTVQLKKPIAIHVRYFTADFVGGGLNIYNDIYARDRPISARLYTDTLISDL